MLAILLPAMLSYRHVFHAGNHADVLKHLVLMLCLEHMNAKDKPYLVVDTHAGAGEYSLQSDQAKRTGEYLEGIARLWPRKDLPAPLDAYLAMIRDFNGEGSLRHYPGSPWIISRLARGTDRLRFCDLHPTDVAQLRKLFSDAGRRVSVEQADGFDILKAALPPVSRRGLILIDPSYELTSDYVKVIVALKDALKRFATGTYLVWHPLIPSLEATQIGGKLRKAAGGDWLHVTLKVGKPSAQGRGLFGSGMFVVNPPWTLVATLKDVMPVLSDVLGLDERTDWSVDSSEQVG